MYSISVYIFLKIEKTKQVQTVVEAGHAEGERKKEAQSKQ